MEHPERHVNAKAKPTKCEQIMLDQIGHVGYCSIFNFDLAPYWIDVYIPELKLGIECFGSNRIPLSYERHKYITDKGIHLIYISNACIIKNRFRLLNNYIRFLYFFRFKPSFSCQDTVIWGTKNRRVFGFKFKIVIKSMSKRMRKHYLLLARDKPPIK